MRVRSLRCAPWQATMIDPLSPQIKEARTQLLEAADRLGVLSANAAVLLDSLAYVCKGCGKKVLPTVVERDAFGTIYHYACPCGATLTRQAVLLTARLNLDRPLPPEEP